MGFSAKRIELIRGLFFVSWILGCGFVSAADLKVAAPGELPVSPFRGLTYTQAGIAKVRKIARETERGKILAEKIFSSASSWLDLSEAELRALIPDANALYAQGAAGDPATGKSWPIYARSGEMCSLDRPGSVRSPFTGTVYGKAGDFYDSGGGWVRPSDGKRFYFNAVWNSWIVRRLHEAVDDLALAYMLTGDEKVAERGLLILDELADLNARQGDDAGIIDNPTFGRKNIFFPAYIGNDANARMLQTVLSLDLLAGAPSARTRSRTLPEKSIFENIRDRYFGIYELNYKEDRNTLYNHTTALFANQIGQAVLFGQPEALKEGLEVVFAWLNQCVTRDGQYYENAGGYERVGVDYFASLLLPLENYSVENYQNKEQFPDPNQYPFGLNLGNHPQWYSAAFLMKSRMRASGRVISFGDMWEDRLVIPGRSRDWGLRSQCAYARFFYARSTRPEWREHIRQVYWDFPETVRSNPSLLVLRHLGMSQWFEPPRPAGHRADSGNSEEKAVSDFLPGKMIALMRSGQGADRRTAFLSGSVPYSHGNDDQMGLILYAKGLCLNGSYGYPPAGSPAHRGWSTKAASHWTLVVNEDLPAPKYPAKSSPPASLQAWVGSQAGSSVQMVEMSNPHLWHHRIAPELSEYRRLNWMVDVSAKECYFLDFFRVTGGHVHDYFFTGQWLDQPEVRKGFKISGVRPKSSSSVWTLAGLNRRYRKTVYNQKGGSWGERVRGRADGRMNSFGISGKDPNTDPYWNPSPGNGYGFIYDVRRADTSTNWSASWDLIDKKNTMRLTFVNRSPQEAITGLSPVFKRKRNHSMVIARRSGPAPLRSRFAALIEVAAKDRWPVRRATRLKIEPTLGMGVSLSLVNGKTDVLLAGANSKTIIHAEGVTLNGARGFVRRTAKGDCLEMLLQEGTKLESGDFQLQLDKAAWEATVTSVSPSDTANELSLDKPLPPGMILKGRAAIFSDNSSASQPRYLQDESFLIESISAKGQGSVIHLGRQRLISSQVTVDSIAEDGGVVTTWPNEIRGGRFRDTGFFTGKQVFSLEETERQTQILAYPDRKKFIPLQKGLFRKGDQLGFRVVKKGDHVRIPNVAILKQTAPRAWILSSTAKVSLQLPATSGSRLYLVRSDRREEIAHAEEGKIICALSLKKLGGGTVRLELRGKEAGLPE